MTIITGIQVTKFYSDHHDCEKDYINRSMKTFSVHVCCKKKLYCIVRGILQYLSPIYVFNFCWLIIYYNYAFITGSQVAGKLWLP